jgi:hypothetical protein
MGIIGHWDFVPMVGRISVEDAGMAAIIQSVVEVGIMFRQGRIFDIGSYLKGTNYDRREE